MYDKERYKRKRERKKQTNVKQARQTNTLRIAPQGLYSHLVQGSLQPVRLRKAFKWPQRPVDFHSGRGARAIWYLLLGRGVCLAGNSRTVLVCEIILVDAKDCPTA